MSRGLQLEFSMGGRDNDTLEATYRNEGLSVGADHMVRFFLSASRRLFNVSFLCL
jgi:hypothetical protein